MSNPKSFLSQVDGFIPVIDVLTRELGLMTAVVYGIVWRYCQMRDGVCRASLETIAGHASIDRRTVDRHIKELCKKGYLKDTTPDNKNAPHIYADTGKVKILGLVSAVITDNLQPPAMTESPSAMTESPSKPPSAMTESHTKRESLIENQREHHGASAQEADCLLSSTPQRRVLKAKFMAGVSSPKGRSGPKEFPTLDVAKKFDQAAARLNGSLETAIDQALRAGINSIPRLVAYIDKFEATGGYGAPPPPPKPAALPLDGSDLDGINMPDHARQAILADRQRQHGAH